MSSHHHVSETGTCPACGAPLTRATNADPGVTAAPVPGDFTVCIQCGDVLCFGDDMSLHKASPSELRTLHPDDRRVLSRAQAAVHRARRVN